MPNDNVIHRGVYSPGERLTITNPNSVAARYRADFGSGGAIILTLPPGGEFTLVFGETAPCVYLEDISPPGLRPA